MNTIRLNLGNPAFEATMVDSESTWARIEIRSGELRYSVRMELFKGQWQPTDMVTIHAYGDRYEIPSDLVYQLGFSFDRLVSELEMVMFPNQPEDRDDR